MVQANDERWRANLELRVTLAKLKQRPPRDGELRLADDEGDSIDKAAPLRRLLLRKYWGTTRVIGGWVGA